MADIAVSISMGVMKPLLEKLATLMGDEYEKLKGLRKVVSFLQRELNDMNALLEMMDDADELNPQARNWRKDIIEMSYNIEDYIDDFMVHVGDAGDNVGVLRKASRYLRTFKDQRRLANQLQEIKTQVIEAGERRKRYMLDQCIPNTTRVTIDPRLSTLYQKSENLVGIDSQKHKIVTWVMDEEQQLKVMSIVGFGGLGKTTLANEVYREVGEKFNCKAIVTISQNPDIIKLLNGLMLRLGLQPCSHAYEPQDLIDNIKEYLQNKRWIGQLCCLRELFLRAKEIHQEDFNIIGTRLTSLVRLRLIISRIPTGRIVIGGSTTGFNVLKTFWFDCDGVSCLRFEAGAMPNLEFLGLVIDAAGWDGAAPDGLQHLPSLKKIRLFNALGPAATAMRTSEEERAMKALTMDVFRKASEALPTRPAVNHRGVVCRAK